MAKSSKKQCRPSKQPKKNPKNGGGLVVVTPSDLYPKSADRVDQSKWGVGKTRKHKKGKQSGLVGDPSPREIEPDGGLDDAPSHLPSSSSSDASAPNQRGIPHLSFSSTHSREQRLYYLLATRSQPGGNRESEPRKTSEGGCHAVVFVEATAIAQGLLGELKGLGLTAFAVHERTPKAQRQDHVKRFRSSSSLEKSCVLILTNAAAAQSLPISSVPISQSKLVRIVHFDAPEGKRNAGARRRIATGLFCGRDAGTAEEVHLEEGGDVAGVTPFAFENVAMGVIFSRLAAAKKLARLVASNTAAAGKEKGMRRAAAAAGLEWDDGSGHRENEDEASARSEKARANAQQVAALRQKLGVLLCQELLPTEVVAARSGTHSTAATVQQHSPKELRKKMSVLGMIRGSSGSDTGVKGAAEDRAAAQTRWLDGADGKAFGGRWDGAVRKGASCDDASLDLRTQVEAIKAGRMFQAGKHRGGAEVAAALEKWKPNPDTPDADRWGGRWGKPCGHNEVVLHHLRPFAPMEVINTRVCSKASPAPGNSGFDGCLELLSLSCRAHGRALTVWDEASLLHIDEAGVCSSLPKQAMLYLPLPSLRFLVKNMRSFTVCGQGRAPPRDVAGTVIRATGWAAKQSQFGPLSTELSSRVLSFVLSGDAVAWRSLAASFGIRVENRARPNGSAPCDTVSFASKKRRKNFNL